MALIARVVRELLTALFTVAAILSSVLLLVLPRHRLPRKARRFVAASCVTLMALPHYLMQFPDEHNLGFCEVWTVDPYGYKVKTTLL